MLSLNNIILFTMAAEIVYCTRHIPTVESSYQQNILSSNRFAERLSCPLQSNEAFSWCSELFSRAHYRFYLKVFHSHLGFESAKPTCQLQTITFVSNSQRFPAGHMDFMLPCVGRHEPIRTSPQIDDYYYRFLLAGIPDKNIFYVFRAENYGQGEIFKFYEEILDMTSPIPTVLESEEDRFRELLLLTIPTINSWSTVESIYVNEVIIPNKPIEDKLYGVQPVELYMLCAFLLTNASYGTNQFIVDIKQIQQWNTEPIVINLYFDVENKRYNGSEQASYPCYGYHYSRKTTENEKHVNLYRISSGPRENSMLVYTHLSSQQDYKITRIHENVDLTGLLVTRPYLRTDEAGPSQPQSKRIRTGQIVPPDISYQIPSQGIATQQNPALQPVIPGWDYQFQPVDEPSPTRGVGLFYSSPTASPKLEPASQIPSPDLQLLIQEAELSRETPAQPLEIQAAGSAHQTPPTSQQVAPSPLGSSYDFLRSDQQFDIQAAGAAHQIPHTSQQVTSSPVGSSYDALHPDQQFDTQAAGLPYPTPIMGQEPTAQPASSRQAFSSDQLFALQTGELPFQTPTIGQQLPPPQVRVTYHVPSRPEQPVIRVSADSPSLAPDEQFAAGVGGYHSTFPSTDVTNQQQSAADYEFDYFTEIPELQPSTDESGLLEDALKPFSKKDPGSSKDT